MDIYTLWKCYVEWCVGEVTSNAWKIMFSIPVVSVAERPWRRRSLYQDTAASLKVMEEGSIVLCQRFVSRMLMRVVPGARVARTYLAVLGSWRDWIMLWRLGGWHQRASSLIMRALSKSVVAHRWYVLMAILDSNTRHHRMSARSPHGPPRIFWIASLAPHTRWMIEGVRVSDQRRRRVQRASVQAKARWLSAILLWMTGWRLVIVAKSAMSMLTKKRSCCFCPSLPVPMPSWVESSPRTRWANILNSASVMWQLCPDSSSSSVLQCGLPPSPTVVAVVLAA